MVKGFLSTLEIEGLLTGWASPSFNPGLTLLKTELAQVKWIVAPKTQSRILSNDERILGECHLRFFTLYAQRLGFYFGLSDVALIDNFDFIGGMFTEIARETESTFRGVHWTNRLFTMRSPHSVDSEGGPDNFPESAIQEKLNVYVNQKLKAKPRLIQVKTGRSLLDMALRPTSLYPDFSRHEASLNRDLSRYDMVSLLLGRGMQPTETLGNESMPRWRRKTVFAKFVRKMYRDGSTSEEDYKIIELMLEHGAVSGLGLWYISLEDDEVYPKRMTVPQMLRTVFSREKAALLEQISMRTQPLILRLWRRHTRLSAHIDRWSYALDDTMYGIYFFVLPAIPPAVIFPFCAGLLLSFLALPLSLPALTLVWWSPDMGLIRLSIFGVVVMGFLGPTVLLMFWTGLLCIVVLPIAWQLLRGLLARDLHSLTVIWRFLFQPPKHVPDV